MDTHYGQPREYVLVALFLFNLQFTMRIAFDTQTLLRTSCLVRVPNLYFEVYMSCLMKKGPYSEKKISKSTFLLIMIEYNFGLDIEIKAINGKSFL